MATKKKITHKKAKAVAKKPARTKHKAALAKRKTAPAKKKTVAKKKAAIRRPAVNTPITIGSVQNLINGVEGVRTLLENYAAHMRALDRKRLNGIGVKLQGFVDKAYALADENQDFLPHWLPMTKFTGDVQLFRALRTLYDLIEQTGELTWNLVMKSSDMAYTDALEFYNSVQEAARRRVDAAESIYEVLRPFFRRSKKNAEEPTEVELKHDINSLLHGKKEGKIVIENIKPKVIGGKKKIIDETIKDKLEIKETAEGSL